MGEKPQVISLRISASLAQQLADVAALAGETPSELARRGVASALRDEQEKQVQVHQMLARSAVRHLGTLQSPASAHVEGWLNIMERRDIASCRRGWDAILQEVQAAISKSDDAGVMIFHSLVTRDIASERMPPGVQPGSAMKLLRELIGQERYAEIWER